MNRIEIPKFIADFIKMRKSVGFGVVSSVQGTGGNREVYEWLDGNIERQEMFARAWLDGYKVDRSNEVVEMRGTVVSRPRVFTGKSIKFEKDIYSIFLREKETHEIVIEKEITCEKYEEIKDILIRYRECERILEDEFATYLG